MNDFDDKVDIKDQTLSYFFEGVKNVWDLLGGEKFKIFLVLLLTLFTQFLDLAFPYVFKLVFDELPKVLSEKNIINYLIFLIVSMLIIRLLALVLVRFVKEPFFLKSLIRLENQWPVMAQEKLLKLSLSYHERENTGKKIAKINRGCDKLVDLLASLFFGLLPSLFYLMLNIVFILVMDWRLGLLFLAPIIPAVYINIKSYEKFTPKWEEYEKYKELSVSALFQSVVGVQTVQSFAQENKEKEKLFLIRNKMLDIDISNSLQIQKYFFMISALLNVFFVLTIIAGVYFIHKGSSTVGTVIFIIATGNVTIQGFWEIINNYTKIMKNLVAAKRMKELLDEPIEVKNNSDFVVEKTKGELRFEQVNFGYSEKREAVLTNLNLSINPSEMVAIVGHSGSGKSTIIKLLNRMYDISSGAITIDGYDIRNVDLYWYRKLFAIVQQDVSIFDATIFDNVAYGCDCVVEKEEVENVLRAAHLTAVIEDKKRFPDGLDTQVGERGIKLSGGERQRVGIARAYLAILKGAKFLILDEATSSLDSEAERAIQDMVETLRQHNNISIIAIAHRLSTIKKSDKIYVIEDGTVIEEGDHARLVKRNGLYSRLVALQELGEIRK